MTKKRQKSEFLHFFLNYTYLHLTLSRGFLLKKKQVSRHLYQEINMFTTALLPEQSLGQFHQFQFHWRISEWNGLPLQIPVLELVLQLQL